MTAVDHVVVAIPVRDEEQLLPGCLDALAAAVERLRPGVAGAADPPGRPPVTVDIVLALDCCTDSSKRLAQQHPVRIVDVTAGAAGAARGEAVRVGLSAARARGVPASRTWLACTDADSRVPPTWLVSQLEMALDGADLVVGTVEPDDVADPAVLAAWWRRHQLGEGHPHIHGANLGVRASAYRAVGGFAARARHEDVDLVQRIRAAGHPWVATDRTRVRTSGRLSGRAGCFAGYLGELRNATSA